jgi:hypothetical protein
MSSDADAAAVQALRRRFGDLVERISYFTFLPASTPSLDPASSA